MVLRRRQCGARSRRPRADRTGPCHPLLLRPSRPRDRGPDSAIRNPDLANASPFVRALSGFIGMEIAFVVLILTAGVGLILYAASLERDVEFAGIIARGSSGWQTAELLVGEAFVIILVGLTIGVGVGLGTAFFATNWLATGPAGVPTSPVPYFFVFPWTALLLVLGAPAAMLLAALLVSVRTAHINLAKVLKLRGG